MEFEELKKQVEEEDLYKEEQDTEQPQVDQEYIESLKDIPLEEALYHIGLIGAQIKKAPNPDAFAQMYAASTSAMLKLIGFQSALAETLGSLMLDAKKRFIIGLVIIAGGIVLTPANVTLPPFEGGEKE